MLSEQHGMHNYAEYAEVVEAVRGSQDILTYWARYGLSRHLGRVCRQLHTALQFNAQSIAEDEHDIWLTFLRVAGPMARELEENLPEFSEYVAKAQDFETLNELLGRSAGASNVLHWARVGVVEGVQSWRHMSEMIAEKRMAPVDLDGIAHDPEAYVRDADLFLARYTSA